MKEFEAGYLMIAPAENDWCEDYLPDEWLDAHGRIRRDFRDRVPRRVWVRPDGTFLNRSGARCH